MKRGGVQGAVDEALAPEEQASTQEETGYMSQLMPMMKKAQTRKVEPESAVHETSHKRRTVEDREEADLPSRRR
jgi:hypothetical protein